MLAMDASRCVIIAAVPWVRAIWWIYMCAFLVEVARGTIAPGGLAARLKADAEMFSPTAPPSGLFLDAVIYPGETFDRPLAPIIPVVSNR